MKRLFLVILCNPAIQKYYTMQDYSNLSDEIRGKLIEGLSDDMTKLDDARAKMVQIMEGLSQHKLPDQESHNFMIETIRTQLEVALDNLDNAVYQTKELLSGVE